MYGSVHFCLTIKFAIIYHLARGCSQYSCTNVTKFTVTIQYLNSIAQHYHSQFNNKDTPCSPNPTCPTKDLFSRKNELSVLSYNMLTLIAGQLKLVHCNNTVVTWSVLSHPNPHLPLLFRVRSDKGDSAFVTGGSTLVAFLPSAEQYVAWPQITDQITVPKVNNEFGRQRKMRVPFHAWEPPRSYLPT